MNKHAADFVEYGYATLDLSDDLSGWVASTLAKAESVWVDGEQSAEGWFSTRWFEVDPIPRVELLEATLSQILKASSYPQHGGQLSTLVDGYGTDSPNRHVDGADNELAWFGLLVGINLVPIPDVGDAGALLVWPGTHRKTQERFDRLPKSACAADVKESIHPTEAAGEPQRVFGPAGTVLLMDHRLEHGMSRHRTSGFRRHVVYFRLPSKTSVPEEVMNAEHFLRHG